MMQPSTRNEPAPHAAAWSSRQTRAQFLAIARLRWLMLVNSFRRKGGSGELIARIIVYPIFAGMALGPSIGVYLGAFFFTSGGHLERLAWLLWATFALCQLLNIQIGQPGSSFDPTQLIRFPLRVHEYVAIRLFFGLLTPANVIGSLMAFCIAVGITAARPRLWLYALVAMAVFAAANVLFSRMVFAWVDRWLSTRRAREVFTGLVFLFSIGIQFLNVAFNPAYNHHRTHGVSAQKIQFAVNAYHRIHPWLLALPPELTTRSVMAGAAGRPAAFLELTLVCALFAVLFLAVFALRMRVEFRGEDLSDAANAVSAAAKKPRGGRASAPSPAATPAAEAATLPAATERAAADRRPSLPGPIAAMLAKELLYVRRNAGIFYSLVMPVVFVFLFAGRLASRQSSEWIFPAALAYTLLGIIPMSYNSFGLEGTGSQFYFLAPVRMRDILLAKNLLGFLLAALEMVAVFAIISYVAGVPSVETALATLLWAAGTLLLSTTLGNRRSISAPKKVNPGRSVSKQASPLSGLIAMGVLLLSATVAAIFLGLALFFNLYWMLVPLFAVFAAVAASIYWRGLHRMDSFMLEHREELFAELCKAS